METLFAFRKIIWLAEKMRKEIYHDYGKKCPDIVRECPICDAFALLESLEKLIKKHLYLL